MSIPLIGSLSTDLSIITTLVGCVFFGVLFGHSKIRNLALASYVGWVLASQLGNGLHNALHNITFTSGISPTAGRLVLYIAPVILLEFSRRHHDPGLRSGFIVTIVLSVATAALLVAGVLSQLDPGTLTSVTGNSSIAFAIYQFRTVALAAVPILVVAESFIRPKERDHHRH